MMAPHHERERVIGEAVHQAGELLQAPVDFLEIKGSTIVVGAGSRLLRGTFQYNNAYSNDGSPMPGSGHWSVMLEAAPPRPRAGWLRRLLGG